MANQYKKRVKADEKFSEGGYKNMIWFAVASTFLSMKRPTATPTVAGDKVTILDTHTFNSGEGFIGWRMKKHSVTHTYETTGEAGAKSLLHKGKAILIGDDAATLEQLRDLLNDDVVFLVKDQDCLTASMYTQFGDDCLTPDINLTGDMKTTAEGLKEQTIEWTVKDKKFFYLGNITEKSEVDVEVPPTTYDSVILFDTDATPAPVAGITGVAAETDAQQKLEFNAITSPSGSPIDMTVKLGATEEAVFTMQSDYAGQAFRYTDKAGVEHTSTFVDGDKVF